jgi:hypothetical protein
MDCLELIWMVLLLVLYGLHLIQAHKTGQF